MDVTNSPNPKVGQIHFQSVPRLVVCFKPLIIPFHQADRTGIQHDMLIDNVLQDSNADPLLAQSKHQSEDTEVSRGS
jgi:hypothetical protein